MPSASLVSKEPIIAASNMSTAPADQQSNDETGPLAQALQIVEKKVRNLEKRKVSFKVTSNGCN